MEPALTYGSRWRLAWELTWPLSVMDLAAVLVLHGLLDVQGETGDSLWALIAFFVASPWVVRRALSRVYGKLKIVVVRTIGGVETHAAKLTYQESLKLMWLLAWRTLVLALGALLILSLALRLAALPPFHYSPQGPLLDNLGLSAADTISSLLLGPFLIPGMLRKRYRGFYLAFDSVGA